MLTPAAILGQDGKIAERLQRYAFRPQQLEMAEAVASALAEQRHLIVEAGTGVGKSFAYLVPAILAITETDADFRRIIVSTHTISLQEQLLSKDLPLLNAVIPREFTAVLAKGRGNYVSLRRLHRAVQRQASLFDNGAEIEQLATLQSWVGDTTDGSLSDMPFVPHGSVWQEIQSDSSNCLRNKCPHYSECFYFRARKRLERAQILVTNHALFFTDLALRTADFGGVLPPYDAVILDEAHTIESVAAEHFGIRVGSGQVSFQLNRLFNPRRQTGQLADLPAPKLRQQVLECQETAARWFAHVYATIDSLTSTRGSSELTLRIRQRRFQPAELCDQLMALASGLERQARKSDHDEVAQDLRSSADRLSLLADHITAWSNQSNSEFVYWVTARPTRRSTVRVELAAAPLEIGATLEQSLFNTTKSVIMTSATLTTGTRGGFEFFQSQIGASDADTLQVGSPFNYQVQAKLILVKGLPDPSSQRAAFEAACIELLPRYIEMTRGRAFCLFTSYAMLKRAAAHWATWSKQSGIAIFAQGMGTPRHQLLEKFKRHPSGVLFGTASFWQGVDVPGEALQNVIITKLPFSVPDHPLVEAKLDAIRARNGNPFFDFQLPEAVIRLKQGFGRLIRTADDSGMVAILDPRVLTKPYGRTFLEALPPCPATVDFYDAAGRIVQSQPLATGSR